MTTASRPPEAATREVLLTCPLDCPDACRLKVTVGPGPDGQERLLKVTGDWAKFKGEGDAAGSLKGAEAKESAEERIAAADKAAAESREGAKKAKEKDASDVEPGSEEAPAEGESTEDAEAAATDEA